LEPKNDESVCPQLQPKKEKSNTSLILKPFLEGLKEVGAIVECLYTKDLEINPCTGEFHCWTKHPGNCYQQDDMQQLYPRLQAVDILVFATPVYVDGVAGPLENLIDRMIPLVEPFFELRQGHCRHPPREAVNKGKLVVVSNCGFWELDNFNPLIVHMKALCKNMSRTFEGALLRPHGPAFAYMLRNGLPVNDIVVAAKEAGRQLVRNGQMSKETLQTISRELLPLNMYVEQINTGFKQALEANEN
jgi:multimeric flavodoxin WrbA